MRRYLYFGVHASPPQWLRRLAGALPFVLLLAFYLGASHLRLKDNPDDSKNLWWVGLLAFGEGWHNNHHAFQRMARHGHKWWEIDLTYYAILALEKVGLAWNVVHDVPQRKRAAGE